MKVNILDIPAQGLQLNITKDSNELQTDAGKINFQILSPVSANLALFKSDGELYVKGNMTALFKLQCVRCLKEFEYNLDSKIEIVYSTESALEIVEKELTKEEIDVNTLKSNEIDIDAILLEQLTLDMPMKSVCRIDCKGLCPKCGTNLNEGKCSCPSTEQVNKRFAKLKEIKLK